jgi:transglutaminase-like putative cysteine protease
MRLKITHRTEYRYDAPIAYALQRVRLLPRGGATQKVIGWSVTIEGAREEARFTDHFDNDTRLISLEGEPRVIAIEATGEVETQDKAGVTGLHRGLAPLWLFMRETELTTPGERTRALAAEVGEGADIARLHQLMALVGTPAAPADSDKPTEAGAAQSQVQASGGDGQDQEQTCSTAEARTSGGEDQAETFIAAARLLGFPARYVSGYLLPDGAEGKAARHAWAEAHVDRLGWVGFDVANLMSPDHNYVRVATGRDHRDAMPVSGIRLGQPDEQLAVSIMVEQ